MMRVKKILVDVEGVRRADKSAVCTIFLNPSDWQRTAS